MHRNRLIALLIAALTVLAGTAAGAAPTTPAVQQDLQKVIVAFEGDLTAQRLAAIGELGVVRAFELSSIDAVAVTALPGVVARLADLPGVVAVQPQRRIELHLYASKEQIGAARVGEAQTYERDAGSFALPGYDGTGVTVGIIDSGIFAEHPGLAGKVTLGLNFEFSEFEDQGVFTAEQWDTYAESTGTSALQDEVGHGTHVGGTVAGTGAGAQNYAPEELAGVAPGADLVSLKIASAANGVVEDYGFEENALFAIDYLIRHPETNVRVTNNSWGLLPVEPSTAEGTPIAEETDYDAANEMVSAASAAGITMVFSAGNDGPEPGTIRPGPGANDSILVAAACKSVDSSRCVEGQVITDFSSRGNADGTGPQVDITAPGDTIMAPVSPSILAPLTECPSPTDEPGYYCISGTSMSSPHIAGVVALMQQANPDLTPVRAEECLEETATDLMEPGFDIHSGAGMADTPFAIACAAGLTASAEEAPAPAPEPTEEPAPAPLPATGGGLALLGLVGLAGAAALKRS